jgi:hypothetical protein
MGTSKPTNHHLPPSLSPQTEFQTPVISMPVEPFQKKKKKKMCRKPNTNFLHKVVHSKLVYLFEEYQPKANKDKTPWYPDEMMKTPPKNQRICVVNAKQSERKTPLQKRTQNREPPKQTSDSIQTQMCISHFLSTVLQLNFPFLSIPMFPPSTLPSHTSANKKQICPFESKSKVVGF